MKEQLRKRVSVKFTEPSLTKQSFKDECDINLIVKRGTCRQNLDAPTYADYSDVKTYQEACNIVIEAQNAFHALPSKVRDYFKNSPQNFLSATEEDLIKCDLLPKKDVAIQPDLKDVVKTSPEA